MKLCTGNFYSPTFTKMNGSSSATGMHKWDGKLTATSVEGKLWTDREGDFFDNSYKYSAKFSAPIGVAAPPPADGGEPAKAYKAYLKTVQGGNIAQIRNAVTGERATLLATAQDGSETMQGTITMLKENGAWKMEQESWKN